MSRHFNYELDERRIKILLKENSMPYSEDVWNDYLQTTKPLTKTNKLQSFKPNVSFAINKSVLLTGVFVILIGSFTFLIARFVDFSSTRTKIETVREVKPNPDNYKIERATASLPVKKEEVKPVEVPAVDSSLIIAQTNSVAAVTASVETKTITPSVNEEIKTAKNTPDTSLNKTGNENSVASQKHSEKPRKKRKRQVETLESKPLTVELPTSGSEDPEPELK